ncbi:MAG: bifunctional 4-hydroxy-2-oxoglutarate aldolase/2-dehydro-3-deoxy-phosphogluconate aldolase [Geminicoccaceae bacterium]|nr:bifunctional 4-hydroxy-2-oxoglutarate aldolase/2-dehydro-3-deoxy-phosphogluconate aldolase [Geminicoccaceae bacterium]
MRDVQPNIEAILRSAPVVPVMVIDDVATAVPLARALVKGGLRVLEITLRTAAAPEAIGRIIAEVEGAIVGAGTVRMPDQFDAVQGLGCAFAVSPGATPGLMEAARGGEMPLLPGAATASEIMLLLDQGYRYLKFFPAGPAGGVPYLKSLASPLPQARFCPTGGIDAANAKDYLALPNVLCVGGSWVAPAKAVKEGAWDEVERLARAAAGLAGTSP